MDVPAPPVINPRRRPPHDYPHVYINMGTQDAILCPYCATRFRFDLPLRPSEDDPPDSLFVDPDLE
jgi:Zinc-finger domain